MTAPEATPAATVMPRIGDPAPSFTAMTTQGPINFPADYSGKWVIFFSHPADFTPVCTSEFMTFASMQKQFAAYNTELVGLSVDGLYSHIAWLRTIKEKISFRDMTGRRGHVPADRRCLDGDRPEVRDDHARRGLDEGRARRVRHRPRRHGPRDHLLPAQPGPQLRRVACASSRPCRPPTTSTSPPRQTGAPATPSSCPRPARAAPPRTAWKSQAEGVECEDWFFCTKDISEADIESAIRMKARSQ